MSWEHFGWSVGDGVGTLTFNRPTTLNSLTFDVYRDLVSLTASLQGDAGVRCVIVTGEGRGFCSGGDVHAIMKPLLEGSVEQVMEFTRMTCDLVRNMRRMPQVIVAAVNGTAAGAGAVIALASDLRIVAEGARFLFLFTKVGLTGADMGTAWLLPRIIGDGRAMEALLFGEPIAADQALAWGLANRVVPADQLLPSAQAWASHLAHGPAEALRSTKRALLTEADMGLEAALDFEAVAQAALLRSRDHREFYESWAEKRPPQWGKR